MALRSFTWTRLAVALVAAGTASASVIAQNPLPRLPPIPGLDRILSAPSALSTSVANAYRDSPILDDEAEATPLEMTSLSRDTDGAFTLAAGVYEFRAKSFCLQAGAPGASRGDGYLAAPLAGPKARIVGDILTRLYRYPDIQQQDAQSLLWAILAGAKFSTLPAELQNVARRLLSTADIVSLEASVVERLWEAVRDQAESRLPPAVFAVLDAQARLRDMLASGASYAEMAAVAVPDGSAEPQDGDREIPARRWSLDPAGFFIRFSASSYSEMTVQVMVPEVYAVERDARQRITAVRSPDGWALEAAYDEGVAPLTVPGDPGIKGYAFKRLVYKQPANGRLETFQIDDQGWAFTGRSNGRGRVPDGAGPAEPARLAHGPSAPDPSDRYGDWGGRYKDTQRWQRDTAPPSERDVDRLTDLKHYGKGAKEAVSGSPGDKASWLGDHMTRLGRAAAYVLCRLEGGCDPDQKGPRPFNPGGRVATPGARGEQRLGSSGVGR
ncbi:MAG: hypothetical protein WCP29_03780 [Acidobacteriota bacterium]